MFQTHIMKRKYAVDFKDQIEEYNAIIKKPKQTGNGKTFDKLCEYFNAIYIGTRFINFVIPQDTYLLLTKIQKVTDDKKMTLSKFLNKDWNNNTKVLNHDVLRVALFLNEYNKHFAITQMYDATYGVGIDNIREQNNMKYKEQDLFNDIVSTDNKSVLSFYINDYVTKPWEWGPEVMTSLNDYFVTGDRKYIDMGNKERCMELLNGEFTELGLVRPCVKFTDHPPIPVNPVNNSTFLKIKKKYLPIPSFYDISMYDNDTDDFISRDTTNITSHHLESYDTLIPDETLLVSVGKYKVLKTKCHSTTIDDFKQMPKNIKNVVLVFKNHGERKNYEMLDHTLCPGLKRLSALFRFVVSRNRLLQTICYTHVKKFN